MNIRRVPGTTIANTLSQEVIYPPPVGEDTIRSLLANWEYFIHDLNGYTQKGNNPNDRISPVDYFYLLYRQAKPNLTQ